VANGNKAVIMQILWKLAIKCKLIGISSVELSCVEDWSELAVVVMVSVQTVFFVDKGDDGLCIMGFIYK